MSHNLTNKIKFKKKVQTWAETIGVSPKQVYLQKMTRKWASCSTTGRLVFSLDLLNEEKDFIEYAIIHELLHLMIPNHGKLFKSFLTSYIPNWRDISNGRVVCNLGFFDVK